MIKKYRIPIILIAILFIGILSFLIYETSSRESSMIKTTIEWSRLAAFPDSKVNFHIEPIGSIFTREYISRFYLTKTELEKWIKDSPGLQDAKISVIDDTTKKYQIKPGGGAAYAYVTINFNTGLIIIDACWS